jgi:hypothetical protein
MRSEPTISRRSFPKVGTAKRLSGNPLLPIVPAIHPSGRKVVANSQSEIKKR